MTTRCIPIQEIIRRTALIVAVCLWFGGTVLGTTVHAETADKIVARVGTEVITQSEFDEALKSKRVALKQEYGDKNGESLFIKYRANALEEMVLEKILAAEVSRENITAGADAVDREYRNRLQGSGMSEPEFVGYLAKNGLSLKAFKTSLKKDIEQRQFVEKKIMPAVSVSDVDLQKEYDNNKGRYQTYSKVRFTEVYLAPDAFANAAAMDDTAAQIRDALRQGRNPTALIRRHSSGAFKDKGGDSGIVEAASLRAEIRDVLARLKPGETSDILHNGAGAFIFKLVASAEPKPLPFSAVANSLRAQLTEQAVKDELRRYLMSVRDETYVQVVR